MKRIPFATLCVLAGAPFLAFFAGSGALLDAQTQPAFFYAQSFRQGPTHITELAFEAKLDPQNPIYRQRIKDAHGADRYVFTLAPQGPVGDNQITSWQAKLADLHHAIYDNILLASKSPPPNPPIICGASNRATSHQSPFAPPASSKWTAST